MNILFIGDIFARAGRNVVKDLLPEILHLFKPDLVIANAENMAHGKGFSSKTIIEMQEAGVDFFTTGNHVWANMEGVAHLNDPAFPVIRPANFPEGLVPGRGFEIVRDKNGRRLLIINLMGRTFMKHQLDNPFQVVDKILERYGQEDLAGIIIDFHAETTAEKYAFGFYVDGRASAVLGTHTHVSTRDARVLPNGTAYISDVGMCGPYDSVIGVKKEIIIEGMISQMPVKHEPEEEGTLVFNSVLIKLDEKTKKALEISYVQRFI